MKFNDWIEKFISKNKIDKLEVLKIEKDFNTYYFTIEQIVGFLKIIEPQEQQEIKVLTAKQIEFDIAKHELDFLNSQLVKEKIPVTNK